MKSNEVDYVSYTDTDSVVGDSEIIVNGKRQTISDFYHSIPNQFVKLERENEVKFLSSVCLTPSLGKEGKIRQNKIVYAMKHRVKKHMYKITVENKSVILTEDHSIIAFDTLENRYRSLKPSEINAKRHRLISIKEDME